MAKVLIRNYQGHTLAIFPELPCDQSNPEVALIYSVLDKGFLAGENLLMILNISFPSSEASAQEAMKRLMPFSRLLGGLDRCFRVSAEMNLQRMKNVANNKYWLIQNGSLLPQ